MWEDISLVVERVSERAESPRVRVPGARLAGRRLHGPRVQDADRPPHVEGLSDPEGTRRPSVQLKALRVVTPPQRRDGICGH